MSWAAQRRFFILLIIGLAVVAFLAMVFIASFYKTPSCADGVANQEENGIDCGGPCKYLCAELQQPPTVLFTKVLDNGAGRTDVIALVENKNTNAGAKNVPYSITLYGADQLFIQKIDGSFDLPPGATEPIFVSGVDAQGGEQKIVSAFLDIPASAPKWFAVTAAQRVVPTVVRATQTGTELAPRIEAILANSSGYPLVNVRAIVLVYNAQRDVIAASETVVPTISAQGQSTALFTWNSSFSDMPASIEVVPIILLP